MTPPLPSAQGRKPANSQQEALNASLGRLPQPLAVLLSDYLQEPHPYVKLHRLCSCTEMLTRFLVALVFGELKNRTPGHALPRSLCHKLIGPADGTDISFERPSFGAWLRLLEESLAELKSLPPPAENYLAAFGHEVVTFARPKTAAAAENSIYELRNTLAHAGRFSNQMARAYLETQGHQHRFESFWLTTAQTFFSNLRTWGVPVEGALLPMTGLANLDNTQKPTGTPDHNLASAAQSLPLGSVFVVCRQSSSLWQLFPLFAVGEPVDRTGAPLLGPEGGPVTHAYFRLGPPHEYTVFHPSLPKAYATLSLQRAFDEQYPVHVWREELIAERRAKEQHTKQEAALKDQLAKYCFRDLTLPILNDHFVGREAHLQTVVTWLEQHTQGAAAVVGAPGSGKTALAVHVVNALQKGQKTWRLIRYFFKQGDHRCSLRSLLEAIQLHLQDMGHKPFSLPISAKDAADLVSRELTSGITSCVGLGRSHSKLVIILDGTDEIAAIDPGILRFVASCQPQNLVWLLLGRPTHQLHTELPEDKCERLFAPDGLPPLGREDVRRLLLDELGPRSYEFLAEESDEGKSRFLDTLASRTRALPLYLHLALKDLADGKFNFRQPQELPKSLDDYYAQILTKLCLDSSRTLAPRIVSLVATAKMPLTAVMLSHLLADEPLRRDKDWEAIFDRGLALSDVVLRQTRYWETDRAFSVYHESFREYLQAQSAASFSNSTMAPELRLARIRLADFCKRWKEWDTDSPERDYALRFCLRHLADLEDWPALSSQLMDVMFLEAKFQLGQVQEVADDMALASHSNLPPTEQDLHRALSTVVRANSDFLSRHPFTLFQCAWNVISCSEPDPSHIGSKGQSVSNIDTQQATLHRWALWTQSQSRPWLRQLWPPHASPKGQVVRLQSGPAQVPHVVLSGDDTMLASVSLPAIAPGPIFGQMTGRPGSLFVWRSDGGRVASRKWTRDQFYVPVAFAQDPLILLVGTPDGIATWNVAREFPLVSASLPPGRLIACASATKHTPARLVTDDGHVLTYRATADEFDTELLPITGKLLCADITAYPDCWLAVERSGSVFIKSPGKAVCVYTLPNEAISPRRFTRHYEGCFDMDNGAIPSKFESNLASSLESFLDGSLMAKNACARFLHRFGLLISPTWQCNAQTGMVASLLATECDHDEAEECGEECCAHVVEPWVWSPPDSQIRKFTWPGRSCTDLQISPDGQSLALGFHDGHVAMLSVPDGEEEFCQKPFSQPITRLALPTHRRTIISACGEVRVIPTERSDQQPCIHGTAVTAQAASADGRLFGTGDGDGKIVIWNAESGQPLHIISPVRKYYVRDPTTQELVHTEDRGAWIWMQFSHAGPVTDLIFSPDSRSLYSFGLDGAVWRWDTVTGKAIAHESLEAMGEVCWPPRTWATMTPDGTCVAMIDATGELVVWDTSDGLKKVFRRPDCAGGPSDVAFSADGRLVAYAGKQAIEVLSLPQGEVIHKMANDLSFLQQLYILRGRRELFIHMKLQDVYRLSWKVAEVAESVGLPLTRDTTKQPLPIRDPDQVIDVLAYRDKEHGLRLLDLGTGEDLPALVNDIAELHMATDYATLVQPHTVRCRSDEREMAVFTWDNDRQVAWFPIPLRGTVAPGRASTILGTLGSEVYILRMEEFQTSAP